MLRLFPLFVLLLCSCVTHVAPIPQEDRDAYWSSCEKGARRIYNGRSVDELMSAAKNVLYLVSPSSSSFSDIPSGFVLDKTSAINPLGPVSGAIVTEKWTVNVTELSNCLEVDIKYFRTIDGKTIQLGYPVESNKLYPPPVDTSAIFFERMDYLLGSTGKWLDCSEAKRRYGVHLNTHIGAPGSPFCGGVSEDKGPDFLVKAGRTIGHD